MEEVMNEGILEELTDENCAKWLDDLITGPTFNSSPVQTSHFTPDSSAYTGDTSGYNGYLVTSGDTQKFDQSEETYISHKPSIQHPTYNQYFQPDNQMKVEQLDARDLLPEECLFGYDSAHDTLPPQRQPLQQQPLQQQPLQQQPLQQQPLQQQPLQQQPLQQQPLQQQPLQQQPLQQQPPQQQSLQQQPLRQQPLQQQPLQLQPLQLQPLQLQPPQQQPPQQQPLQQRPVQQQPPQQQMLMVKQSEPTHDMQHLYTSTEPVQYTYQPTTTQSLTGSLSQPVELPENKLVVKQKKERRKTKSPPPGMDRPTGSYPNLIALAILSCTAKKMLITEIYDWFTTRYPCLALGNFKSWRNRVRNTLTKRKLFVINDRSDGGRGNYYSITPQFANNFEKSHFNIAGCKKRKDKTEKVQTHLSVRERQVPVVPTVPNIHQMLYRQPEQLMASADSYQLIHGAAETCTAQVL